MIFTHNPQQWTAHHRLPMHYRILALPVEVRDFVHKVNIASGLGAIPAPVTPDAGLLAELGDAIRAMPAAVHELVAPLLLGICLGRGIGSSGITDIVADAADGRILGCIVVLDMDLLAGHTANSWATWKENLPFTMSSALSLGATIAVPEQDTRANAMQFLLLHEFGHVVTAGGAFLPHWWEPLPEAQFPFLRLSWGRNTERGFVARSESDFPLRGVVDFYGNNKLDSDDILTVYTGLEGSDFPSLYGATNPYDDFAECFASYVHSELLQRPYILTVNVDGLPQAWLDNFWASPRSASKRAFMHAMLAAPAQAAGLNENNCLAA